MIEIDDSSDKNFNFARSFYKSYSIYKYIMADIVIIILESLLLQTIKINLSFPIYKKKK